MAEVGFPTGSVWEQDVPKGHVACVITYLRRTRGSVAGPLPSMPEPLSLDWVSQMTPQAYRQMFREVGGNWLWSSRLLLSDDALGRILSDPDTHVAVLKDKGVFAGFAEMSTQATDTVTLSFIGLMPSYEGQGLGAILLEHAIAKAWRPSCEAVLTQTCTLDHPSALAFYQRHGFSPVRRAVEVGPDPRVTGLLPADVQPLYPVL